MNGCFPDSVIPDTDLYFQETLRYQGMDKHVVDPHRRAAQQIHVLPDAVDVVSPHRPGRHNPAADAGVVFELLLGLDEHADIGLLPGTDDLGDIGLEREEKVEVLRYLLPVHEHLCLAGDGLEM